MRIYLDAHSNEKVNKTTDYLEQFVDNILLKKYLFLPPAQKKTVCFGTCSLSEWIQPTSNLTGNCNTI